MSIQLEQQPANLDTWLTRKLMDIECQLFAEFDIMIAGGSVKKALFGEDLGKSDIDVWFKSSDDWRAACEKMRKLNCKVRPHPNCAGVTVNTRNHPVGTDEGMYLQLISKENYPSMEDLLERFDFTVCQFGYKDGTFFYPKAAYQHALTKQLIFTNSPQEPNLKRYVKYVGLGYTPSVELFERIFIEGRDHLFGASIEITDDAPDYDVV